MKLSEFKNALNSIEKVSFLLPDGNRVPAHFHLTEIGNVNKNYMDCGGTIRQENKVSFQLWTSVDYHHRLKSVKLKKIIEMAEDKINLSDGEIEVEYQGDTIQKFHLAFNGIEFELISTQTDCLAKDNCGIPVQKVKKKISEVVGNCCEPGSGCC